MPGWELGPIASLNALDRPAVPALCRLRQRCGFRLGRPAACVGEAAGELCTTAKASCGALEAPDESPVGRSGRCSRIVPMPAEVDDSWLQVPQLPEQVHRLRGPACLEAELVTIATSLELVLNHSRFHIQCEPVGAERIGGQE